MEQYAHKATKEDVDLFYNVMLLGREIKTQKEKEEIEASYFAMCLLLPKPTMLKIVELSGGFDKCMNRDMIKVLSDVFRVEERLVAVRLKDLKEQQDEKDNIDLNNHTKENLESIIETNLSSFDQLSDEEQKNIIERIRNKINNPTVEKEQQKIKFNFNYIKNKADNKIRLLKSKIKK